jgi:hypothetical protein
MKACHQTKCQALLGAMMGILGGSIHRPSYWPKTMPRSNPRKEPPVHPSSILRIEVFTHWWSPAHSPHPNPLHVFVCNKLFEVGGVLDLVLCHRWRNELTWMKFCVQPEHMMLWFQVLTFMCHAMKDCMPISSLWCLCAPFDNIRATWICRLTSVQEKFERLNE